MYGLLTEELDTPNSARSAAPKVTHSLEDTLYPPCVRDVFRHNKSPLLTIAHFGDALLQTCFDYFHINGASPGSASTPNLNSDGTSQFRVIQSHPQNACIACGCGDNTIGHWSRWCIIPFTVAWIILRPSYLFQCLFDLAVVSPRYNTICTITIAAFRRLLRQEGAFFHQPICWWIDTLLLAVSQDAPQILLLGFWCLLPVLQVSLDFVIPPRLLDLDDRQGFTARSATQ